MNEEFEMFFNAHAEADENGKSNNAQRSLVRCTELNKLVREIQDWAGYDEDRMAWGYPAIQELRKLQIECIGDFLSEEAAFIKEVYEREFKRRLRLSR